MSFNQSRLTIEERRLAAMHLVSKLDAAELLVLIGLAKGMSRRAIAAASNRSLDDVETALASLMKKLDARTIADVVRLAIYANLSLPR